MLINSAESPLLMARFVGQHFSKTIIVHYCSTNAICNSLNDSRRVHLLLALIRYRHILRCYNGLLIIYP